MTCFCFTFVSRSFWTLELTRFQCLAQERQSGVIGSVVKKSLCERVVFWKDGSSWFLVFRDTRGTSFSSDLRVSC